MQSREQQLSEYGGLRFGSYRDKFQAISVLDRYLVADIVINIKRSYYKMIIVDLDRDFTMDQSNYFNIILHARKWTIHGYALCRRMLMRDINFTRVFWVVMGRYYIKSLNTYEDTREITDINQFLHQLAIKYAYSGWINGDFVIWITPIRRRICWK